MPAAAFTLTGKSSAGIERAGCERRVPEAAGSNIKPHPAASAFPKNPLRVVFRRVMIRVSIGMYKRILATLFLFVLRFFYLRGNFVLDGTFPRLFI